MKSSRPRARAGVAAALLLAAGGLAACGSSDNGGGGGGSKPTSLAFTVKEAGKKATFSGPGTTKGGLVSLKLTNSGKAPHGAQLVQVRGNHTAQQALKILGADSPKVPDWIRGLGGIGSVPPGQTAQASVNLPAGKYLVTDATSQGGVPPYTQLTVNSGKSGSLPSTATTVVGQKKSEKHYDWQVSGQLKPGKNDLTFKSEGEDALHLIAVARVKGNPSEAEIKKGFAKQGPPPSFIDQSSFQASAVLDGGRSQTTPLYVSKPGKYVLFCPLTDREGGKPHLAEGMLKTVTVK